MNKLTVLAFTVTYPEDWDEEEDIDALSSAISNLEYDGFQVLAANEVPVTLYQEEAT